MKVDTINVNYIIDGKLTTKSTKIFYNPLDEYEEMQDIHLEVQLNNHLIQSKVTNSAEHAIKYFQKALPEYISIACCQSCQHGNFSLAGDVENEIFCLKDTTPCDKSDVDTIFMNLGQTIETRSRKLLDFCKDYKLISDDKYTYNDWGAEDLS